MEFLVGDTLDFRNEKDLKVVEIATLEEFLAFVANEEDDVIVHCPLEGSPWKLEVYNGYRE